MGVQISEIKNAELQEIAKQVDRNNDGKLKRDEYSLFAKAAQAQGIDYKEINEALDMNGFQRWWYDADKVSTDGKDDGHISAGEKALSFGEGFLGGIVKGIIKHPVESVLSIAGFTLGCKALACIPVAGPYIAAAVGIGAGLYFGISAIVKGIKQTNNAETDGDAKTGMETTGTGAAITTLSGIGLVKWLKGIKASNAVKTDFNSKVESSRATLGMEDSEVLSEVTLKKAYRQAAFKNHPDKGGSEAAMAEVTAAYEFLLNNLKSAQKVKPTSTPVTDVPVNEASANNVVNMTGEQGLVLASPYNNATNAKPIIVPLNPNPAGASTQGVTNIVSIETGLEVPTTVESMRAAIENATDIDILRSYRGGMKNMPLYIKELYAKKEMALRENLLPEQKAIVNTVSNPSEISEKAKFIKYLDSSYAKGGVLVKMEGETAQTKYIKYLDSQEGSNSGFWIQHPENGKLYYIKYAPWEEKNGHIQAEIEASKLYNLAGIKTPTIKGCVVGGKYRALASEYVPNMKSISKPEEIHIGFAADAWLANWDSTIDENTRIVNGEPLKLDNGGSLNYRAMGMKKESFDTTVDELVSLVDGTNSASQEIYSSISYETLVKSFEKVCSISDKAIFETVQDKAIAIILIKRRNYMSSVLENIKKTPYNGNNIAEYMKNVTQNLTKSTYNSYRISDDVLAKYQQEVDTKNKIAPSTIRIHKILLSIVKEREKEGIVISREELIEYFDKQIIQELPAKGLDGFQAKAHRENSKHIFITLKNIAEKTPIKDGEKISLYLNRIIKLSEKRQKQLDNLRIKTIKDLLKYETQDEIKKYNLTKEEKLAIIKAINDRINDPFEIYPKSYMVSENASNEEILSRAKYLMVGNSLFTSKEEISNAFINMLERYNSSAKPTDCIMDETVKVPTDYATEFKYEPVYRWLSFDNPDTYIKSLPKNGGIVESQGASCSMNKFYAESEYNDSNPNMNVKLIIHPKSQISHARILGHNYEVLYKGTQKFVVLNKELVEYTDPESKLSCFRWEVHLQEY